MEEQPKTKFAGFERAIVGLMLGWGVCVGSLLAAVTWFHMFPSILGSTLRLLAASLFTPMLLLVCGLSAFDRRLTRRQRLGSLATGVAAAAIACILYSIGFTADRASLDGAAAPLLAQRLWEIVHNKVTSRRREALSNP